MVLDNDGVLMRVADMDRHYRAIRRSFAIHGVGDPATEDVDDLSVGVTLSVIGRIADDYGIDPAAFWETRDRMASAAQIASIDDGHKQPYADAAVVRDLPVPAAVVSSNQQATLDFLLDRFGFARHLESVYGRAPTLVDVVRKKPAPYFVTRALTDLERARGDRSLDLERVLMVGDSESDVRAAHAAGIDAAFLRREHRQEYALGEEPEYELDGLDELSVLLDGA